MTNINQDYLDGFNDAKTSIAEAFELLSQFGENSELLLDLAKVVRETKVVEDNLKHPPSNFRDNSNGE